jgi:hypothetical protein
MYIIVEPYQLPYEAEVGLHPTVSEIREVVVTQKRRPITRPIARQHMVCVCIFVDRSSIINNVA